LLFSCSKEYSLEDAGAAARDCRVSSIIAVDDVSGQGVYAMNTRFNSGDLADFVELFDSVRNAADIAANLTYRADSVFSSENDAFALDASQRVKKHTAPLDPADPGGEKIIYEYQYDGNGYLVKKTISSSFFPVGQVVFTYTWTAGNLTGIEGDIDGLGKFLTARMEYDLSKSPKNFIYIFPEGVENFLFINALNYGKKPANLIKTIQVEYFDDQGTPQFSYNTTIRDVVFSSDGYVQEWFVEGDSFDPLGIFVGKNKFTYSCK
jgi:hypothetical protein